MISRVGAAERSDVILQDSHRSPVEQLSVSTDAKQNFNEMPEKRKLKGRTKESTLERSRQNQRRSRANKKEFVDDLKQKVDFFEKHGVQASAEMQTAARKVQHENAQLKEEISRYQEHMARYERQNLALRQGLRHMGVSEEEIHRQYGTPVGTMVPGISVPREQPLSPTSSMSDAAHQLENLFLQRRGPQSPVDASDSLSPTRGAMPFPRPLPTSQTQSTSAVAIPRLEPASREENLSIPGTDPSSMVASARSSFSESTGVPPDEYAAVSQAPSSSMYPIQAQAQQNVYSISPTNTYPMMQQRWPTQYSTMSAGLPPPMPIATRVQPLGPQLHQPMSQITPIPSMHSPTSPIHNVTTAPPILQHPTAQLPNAIYQPISPDAPVAIVATGATLHSSPPPITQPDQSAMLYHTATNPRYPPDGLQGQGRGWQ